MALAEIEGAASAPLSRSRAMPSACYDQRAAGGFPFSPRRLRKLSPRHHRGLFTARATGGVLTAKVVAKRKERPGRTDRAEFERFIEAARKRGVDETLEEFAARFRKTVPPKRHANDHP